MFGVSGPDVDSKVRRGEMKTAGKPAGILCRGLNIELSYPSTARIYKKCKKCKKYTVLTIKAPYKGRV